MTKLLWRDTIGIHPFTAIRKWKIDKFPLHTHDFAEVFWIEGGRIRHHINGSVMSLEAGSVVMIRAEDCHGFSPVPGEKIMNTNISFPLYILEGLRTRYFSNSQIFWWSQDTLPWMQKMSPGRLTKLNEWADELSRAPREPFYIDRFLLNLLGEFSSDGREVVAGDLPEWLAQACAQAANQLTEGVEGFFLLCGRSREHVARTMRQHMKTTPTDFFNKLRMEHAKHELQMGNRQILDIAMDCGLEDISHFYALFRRETGTTPRAYRVEAHRRLTPSEPVKGLAKS